jgi:hypothetical protein
MKPLLLLAGLLLSRALTAETIVVFAKGDSLALGPGAPATAPTDPARAAFLAATRADLARPAVFATPLALGAPPEWGKTVPGAGGTIQFHDRFRGGFPVVVTLQGLTPLHRYILTLNGNPKLEGNERLVDPVPGLPAERYYDFQTIATDAHGAYAATFAIVLPAGPYGVRFYVKDTADFKIVLYHDYFHFAVE